MRIEMTPPLPILGIGDVTSILISLHYFWSDLRGMKEKLKIIPVDLLESYCLQVRQDMQISFDSLRDAEISTGTFSFYISVSSVYSSKIEGEDIELDSYVKRQSRLHLSGLCKDPSFHWWQRTDCKAIGKMVSRPKIRGQCLVCSLGKKLLPASSNLLQPFKGLGFRISRTGLWQSASFSFDVARRCIDWISPNARSWTWKPRRF